MDEIIETIIELLTHKGRHGIDERQTIKTLSFLEQKIASSPSFHVVGKTWSLADIYTFMFVSELNDADLSAFPRLENFIKSFHLTLSWSQPTFEGIFIFTSLSLNIVS